MKLHPCAKINLGLNIVSKRPDGYHNLETVFYPVPITDTMEIGPGEHDGLTLSLQGATIEGELEKNLVYKAYQLLRADFNIPPLHITLDKRIPMQAGMGGGSSDGAYALRLINDYCNLSLSSEQMEQYAARLGADCAFFIKAEPAYAEGIGELLTPLYFSLADYYIAVVKPDIAVSTREAFANIRPCRPDKNCREVVLSQPIETWRQDLINDFEASIFPQYPRIAEIKQQLYDAGALYASMTGSGSSVFGIFADKPVLSFPQDKLFMLK